MQPRHLASLIEAMDKWLDEHSDEFILTPEMDTHMANAAAAVFDGMQEAIRVTEELEAEEAG